MASEKVEIVLCWQWGKTFTSKEIMVFLYWRVCWSHSFLCVLPFFLFFVQSYTFLLFSQYLGYFEYVIYKFLVFFCAVLKPVLARCQALIFQWSTLDHLWFVVWELLYHPVLLFSKFLPCVCCLEECCYILTSCSLSVICRRNPAVSLQLAPGIICFSPESCRSSRMLIVPKKSGKQLTLLTKFLSTFIFLIDRASPSW